MIKSWLIGLIILLNTQLVWSDNLSIVVVGLFTGHAVVEVNQKQHILTVGKTTPEGVKLISATSRNAVLEVNGEQKEYVLGNHISTNFTPPPAQPEVTIWPTNGMYLTTGSINGYTVDFVVDTGASTIALNAETAHRLNIDFLNAPQLQVKTASKIELAHQVTLDKVQIGDITLHNVIAIVIDGQEPSIALLGMTFLSKLDMTHANNKLLLKKKF